MPSGGEPVESGPRDHLLQLRAARAACGQVMRRAGERANRAAFRKLGEHGLQPPPVGARWIGSCLWPRVEEASSRDWPPRVPAAVQSDRSILANCHIDLQQVAAKYEAIVEWRWISRRVGRTMSQRERRRKLRLPDQVAERDRAEAVPQRICKRRPEIRQREGLSCEVLDILRRLGLSIRSVIREVLFQPISHKIQICGGLHSVEGVASLPTTATEAKMPPEIVVEGVDEFSDVRLAGRAWTDEDRERAQLNVGPFDGSEVLGRQPQVVNIAGRHGSRAGSLHSVGRNAGGARAPGVTHPEPNAKLGSVPGRGWGR